MQCLLKRFIPLKYTHFSAPSALFKHHHEHRKLKKNPPKMKMCSDVGWRQDMNSSSLLLSPRDFPAPAVPSTELDGQREELTKSKSK